jgi:transposase-like protein
MKTQGLIAPQYRDEDAARKHIEKIRWPDGPVCPHCGEVNKASPIQPKPGSKKPVRKGVWYCLSCEKQFTVTVGSIFEDSHIPLHKWLLAIHLMLSSKKGVSAHQLMRNLEIGSYRSAWFMAHRIRWALTQEPVKGLFGGNVEMDETYIGGKLRCVQGVKPGERPKDRLAWTDNKAAVVSVLQRGGSIRSFHVEKVTAKNLRPIVDEMIAKDAHLMTDTSTVLASAGTGRKHSMVNHSEKEYVRMESGEKITTNTVEGYFSILKRGNIGIYHHWSKKYMGQYLREFDWRYNARKLPDMERTLIALKMTGGKRLMLKTPINGERNDD